MAFERAQRLAALQVPDPQRSCHSEPETARRPSGVTATALTAVRMTFERAERLAALQVPEPQRLVSRAETARRPSGVTATALTESVWPSSVRIRGPPGASKTRGQRPKPRQSFASAACFSKASISWSQISKEPAMQLPRQLPRAREPEHAPKAGWRIVSVRKSSSSAR